MAILSNNGREAKKIKYVDDQVQCRNNIDRLPHDLFLDILCRLPITSLVQFRLVCSAWNNKLSHDSELVNLQLSHSVKKDPCLIFQSGNHLSFVDLSGPENNEQVRELTLPGVFNDVVSSCNGLLCISSSIFYDTLYIYNPFTRNYKELPKFTALQEVQKVAIGFGFHPSTKEYKVVKIVYYFSNVKTQSDVQILDLSSNKWRRVGQIPYLLDAPSTGVLVNGRLHWVTQERGTDRVIVSFDLGNEGFQEIPRPDFDDMLTRSDYHISVLEGCLSAGITLPNDDEVLQIWVMKEYNVKESWECLYSIRANANSAISHFLLKISLLLLPWKWRNIQKPRSVSALCRRKNGEILLKYKDGTLASYDPKIKETRNLMFKGMPDYCIPIVHVGSLSWIDSDTAPAPNPVYSDIPDDDRNPAPNEDIPLRRSTRKRRRNQDESFVYD